MSSMLSGMTQYTLNEYMSTKSLENFKCLQKVLHFHKKSQEFQMSTKNLTCMSTKGLLENV
jgi:hypothetical protein